ncbi:hypothetical protein ADK67_35465 [Saccharothrix sp. NRRL B-16348]|jgi:hypothetical protein|uniref:hypothetical protein n=1 Tax=Saccharothrix sp. NRRL B-16348 TaxID=1415542 RepID=UPI0006AEA05D|nr:hypothetical protein [Saccharothrix sp. NRRL B-16348]KOX18826.1 hypothetical protein ADK67_35465 [Saccharothrix sp. NRRL B-16348]
MHRLTAMTATAAALVAALHTTAPSERAWRKQGDFNNAYLCQTAGAAGVFSGQWDDWKCDDNNTLWVDK